MYPVLLYEVRKRMEVKRSESTYIGLRGIELRPHLILHHR